MLIVPYAPHHLQRLALQPHQEHLGVALRERGWAERVSDAGPCWTALVDREPIACGGFQECWEGRAIAWAILGAEAGRHMLALTRAARRGLRRHPAVRIEAQALMGFAPAARWAELLGFMPEGVLRQFHQGCDYQAFVFLKAGAGERSIIHEPIDRQRRGIGDDDIDQDNNPEERAAEVEGGEQVDSNRRHRNQNPVSARDKEADGEAGRQGQDVVHPDNLEDHSTRTRASTLEPKALADKRGAQAPRERAYA
ncbi:hypothetical protein [Dongia sp. agr-C8]